jgi:hypothetical protein
MGKRLVTAPVLAVFILAVIASAALSSTTEGPATYPPAARISLEVYCYTDDLDIPLDEAEENCSQLGEFGLVWEQTLEVLDAEGAVIETVVPQVVADNSAVYAEDGGWRAPEPILPEGWTVIECPFLGDDDTTITNGTGLTFEAEDHTYEDRVHVVCYQLGEVPAPTPSPTPAPTATAEPTQVPVPRRVDTGGGGTA